MRLLLLISNTDILYRTVSKLSQIIVHILDEKRPLCVLAPLWGLGAMYTIYLGLIGKLVVDFLFVLIELFSRGVMAEVLRANIDWKSALLKIRLNDLESYWSVSSNFYVEGEIPTNHFCMDR